MTAQANAPRSSGGRLWMKSMVTQNIGADAARMVADVQHKERRGRVRQVTNPGKKKSDCYTKNTMGYQILDK